MTIALLVIVAVELLAVVYYLYLSLQHAKGFKQIDRTDELISAITSSTTSLLTNVSDSIEASRKDIAARIIPTEAILQRDEAKEELKAATTIMATQNPPKCQFCGSVLGKVKRRADGYMCCSACSIKHFQTAQQ